MRRRPRPLKLPVAPELAALLLLLVSAAGPSCFPLGGGALLSVESPHPGEVVRPGGVEVLVRFAPHGRVAPETFRCLLNGHDVTQQLTTGENGAYGRLYPVFEGENVLRLEIFGRTWWSRDSLIQESREVRFRLRGDPNIYRG